MDNNQTIVILGGGVGGVVSAVELRKKLPKQHRIVLVEREVQHLFAPSLLWLMIGQRTAEKISRPLDRLRKKGIDVVRGEIERIEPAERRVTVNGESIVADHLIISLGAELSSETIPGLAETGHSFYTLEGAESLRDAAEPGPMGVAGKEITAAVRQMVEDKGIGFHPEHQITHIDPDQRRMTFANGAQADFDNFYAEPLPEVKLHNVGRRWHAAKILFEKDWLRRWF